MSADLALGIFLIAGLSVLCYRVGRRVGLESAGRRQVLLVVSLLAAVAFSRLVAGKLAWAWWVPMASVVYWSNLMPAMLSLTAGLVSRSGNLHRLTRPTMVVLLLMLTVGYAVTPVARPMVAPAETELVSTWRDEVCLQSHEATCAPAAAATLLRTAGIDAGETDLIQPCLTSSYGTEPLGLYRGLAIAAKGHPYRPEVASSDPSNWIEGDQLPNLALIRFESTESAGSPKRLLGQRGEGHAVVILGRDPRGNWIIADPAFGRTLWSESTFRERFTGDAIYLTPR